MHKSKEEVMSLTPVERRWQIEKFLDQKQRENEAIESAKRKAKRK